MTEQGGHAHGKRGGPDRGRVTVVGSINADLVALVEQHPRPGETLFGSSLSMYPGGKGANQAVAAARAGAVVRMIGAVGDDSFGRPMIDHLVDNGIDVAGVAMMTGISTGTALIVVDASGENSIVVISGANGAIDVDALASVTFSPGELVMAQHETPVPTTAFAFVRARAAGARTMLNPAPAAPIDDDLLRLVDVLVVNEHELEIVSGTDVPADGDAALRRRGFTGTVVVTLGARGSVSHTADGRTIDIAGRKVTAVDTTGAGDCFCGYLAQGLATAMPIELALDRANHAASICVQRRGAGPSMPSAQEVDA